jgi:hypothetical protein
VLVQAVTTNETAPLLVEPEVSRTKFRRELDLWLANGVRHERGWVLLTQSEATLSVEVAFLARLSTSVGTVALPVVACAIRLTYENYDIWPPSLTFIDVFTRQPTQPHVRAFMPSEDGPRDVLIDGHPDTGIPFVCFPGIREYHSHPQHSGDSWLLHRSAGEGSLSTVCDRVWRFMARNVVGLSVNVITLPGIPLRAKLNVNLLQGQIAEAPVVPAQVPEKPAEPQGSP